MKLRRIWPAVWIVLCTLFELADRVRPRGPGDWRRPRRRRAADQKKKRPSGQS